MQGPADLGKGRMGRMGLPPPSASLSPNGLFPSGQSQATVTLPALMLQVDADAVLADPGIETAVREAVSAGATAVLLSEGASGASALYDAACTLREALRGRAALLLIDRTDIATAAEADGVLLTDLGEQGCSMHAVWDAMRHMLRAWTGGEPHAFG